MSSFYILLQSVRKVLVSLFLWVLIVGGCWLMASAPAGAAVNDDRLDGNIFVVYAGNGALVPSKISLAQSLKEHIPTVIVYYLDDSRDCKQFALVVSRIQEFYGRATSIIPISVDAIPPQSSYQPNELGYYYKGYVPQTVVLDQTGKVVLDASGVIAYEVIDDKLRKVFNLLPRSQSTTLKRQTFNEFNSELVESK